MPAIRSRQWEFSLYRMDEPFLKDFREFQLADRELILPFLLRGNPDICVYNFSYLFCWGKVCRFQWKVEQERLLIYDGRDDFLLMPLGETLSGSELLALSDSLRGQGKSGDCNLLDRDFVERNREMLSRYFELTIDEALSDYVYSTRKLVELKGPKLRKKRNLISQFRKNYPAHSVGAIEEKHHPACLALAARWCEYRDECRAPAFSEEANALRMALQNFGALGLRGLVLRVGEELEAFAIFDRLNDDTAVVHFEKSNLDLKGAAQAINWETAKFLSGTCEFINREEDMGIEGLRQAKRSYSPEKLVASYTLRRKRDY